MFFRKNLMNKSKSNLTTSKEPLNNDVELIASPFKSMDYKNKGTVETNPTPESSVDSFPDQSLLGSSILFSKFKNQYSGPDVLFENEAWAQNNDYVGLFRKRRALVEEQTSLTSDSE